MPSTAEKIRRELGWSPSETFETGVRRTVRWYLDNAHWVANVTTGAYGGLDREAVPVNCGVTFPTRIRARP